MRSEGKSVKGETFPFALHSHKKAAAVMQRLFLIPQISGGATRDRTADLLHAMQALSQLSYSP